MYIAIISDIHANLTALQAVINDINQKYKDSLIFHLGDCIDYGMRPNEVIKELIKLKDRIVVNIQGNHERALFGYESERFSSKRGSEANLYTQNILNNISIEYIRHDMNINYVEYSVNNKKVLAVHGDLTDVYWGKMTYEEIQKSVYSKYDYVFSGHTHKAHMYSIEDKLNKHSTKFINPGSVGQPRNYNNMAQYCAVNIATGQVHFESVEYNIQSEYILYNGEVDKYYQERLLIGE